MAQAGARFYDGITPAPRSVVLSVVGPMLVVVDDDGRELVRWLISDLRLPGQDDSIGEAMIVSRAHPDARLLVSQPQTVALLQPHLPAIARIIAPRPSNLRVWSLVAVLAVAVLGGVVLAVWRGPQLVAPLVPQSWERELGDLVLAEFSGRFGVCNAPEGSQALQRLTGPLIAAAGREEETKVVVVKSRLVNAFALPGGRIVLFDGLIQEAVAPDEVAGVFAHELGHVVHRHPMRGLLRQMGIGLLRRMALGGYGDAVDIAGSLGESVLVLSNGREAEREADVAALGYLAAAGLKQNGLHDFFARMAAKGDAGAELGILSTHPALDERMQATRRSDAGRPALDHGDWQALRKICSQSSAPERPRSNPRP
ncbi:MAG: M48 family metallopeptidase [Reyranellaceae bacterium]